MYFPTVINENSNWWTTYCSERDFENLECSGKLILLFSILAECSNCGDKLLVFSQSLSNLNLIEKFLSMITENTKNLNPSAQLGGFKGEWKKDTDYFRLDGNTDIRKRKLDCEKFNDDQNIQSRFVIRFYFKC